MRSYMGLAVLARLTDIVVVLQNQQCTSDSPADSITSKLRRLCSGLLNEKLLAARTHILTSIKCPHFASKMWGFATMKDF